MKTTFKTLTLAALTATTLIGSTAAPALAGKKERAFLAGVLATVAVGALVTQANAQSRATTTPTYDNNRYTPVTRRAGDDWRHEHRYRQTAPRAPVYTAPVATRPGAESAFYGLSYQERRLVQQRLARLGYYGYGIDGLWGPGTERAVRAFARDNDVDHAINNPRDARKVYTALLTY